MEWKFISADDWKPHAVPEHLVDALVADMKDRDCKGDIKKRPLEDFGMDLGGMCYADRPFTEFQFAGIKFSVPCEYVKHFHDVLKGLGPREFVVILGYDEAGDAVTKSYTYYKLHSHYNCIVLTPPLRKQLLRSLERRVDKAEAIATAFYLKKKPTNVVLAEVAKKVSGIEAPPEAFGIDRQARFRKKARA